MKRLALLLLASLAACGSGGGSDAFRFTSVAPTRMVFHDQLAYQATVASSVDSPTFTLAAGPSGMTLSPGGLLQWSPTYDDLGTYAVELRATNSLTTITQSFDLRVSQGIRLGVTLSPRGHTGSASAQDWIDHYSQHADYGRIIAFHSAWRDDVASAGLVPQLATVAMLAGSQYGFTPAVGLGWSSGDGTPDLTSDTDPLDNSWNNAETRAEFLTMVSTFAQTWRPLYLFLGNETNTYFVSHTQPEWDAWISMFEECYDAIKAVSPDTIVYTTFQLEHMKGGGALNGWADPPHFHLIADHVASGKIDAFGFTSYPYFDFPTPGSIPPTYYDEISVYVQNRSVIFSEIGWLSAPSFPYPGGRMEQSQFVDVFFDRTRNLALDYITWLFQHDFDGDATIPSVRGIGLRNNDGSDVRPADGTWRGAVLLREL